MRPRPFLVAVALGGLAAASSARADDALQLGGFDLGASITAGYRMVDIDGSKAKYREDYNLRSGLRLFDLDVGGVAADPQSSPVDRFHLLVETPGDEPVSTYQLTASDQQRWDFSARFTRSKYWYQVPQLFEQPVAGDVRTDDLHDWDTIRTNGAVDLTLRLPNLPKLFFGYRLYQEEGDTTSTLYVPGGDTFLLRAPIDARTNVALAGTDFTVLGASVLLEQQYRWLARDVGRHGPPPGSAGAGVDPTDGSTLGGYNAFGNDSTGEPITIVRLSRPIGDRVEVTGNYFYSHADLDSNWTTGGTATTDTAGVSDRLRSESHATATRDTNVFDLGASVRLTPTLTGHATYRFDEQTQSGGLDQLRAGTGPVDVGAGYDVRLNRVTTDLQWQPRRDLSLRGGLRYAWRDANLSNGPGPIQTQTLGAIADVRWRPASMVDLFARYESAQVDDPYVVAADPTGRPPLPGREIELTFINRASTGFSLRPRDWIRLSYRFAADSRENDTFAARSAAFSNTTSVTVTPLPGLSAVAGYSRRDLAAHGDVAYAPVYATTTSVQDGSEDVFTTQLTYDFALWGQRWTTGCHVYYVQTDQHWRPGFEPGLLQTDVLYDLDRVDGGATLVWHHPWVEPSIEFRMIDYNERVLPGNDYRATIVTFALTRRFGTASGY